MIERLNRRKKKAGLRRLFFFFFLFFLPIFFSLPDFPIVCLARFESDAKTAAPSPAPFFFGLSAKGGAGGAEKEKLNGAIRKARAVLLRSVPFGSARGRGGISAGLMGSMRTKGREGGKKKPPRRKTA